MAKFRLLAGEHTVQEWVPASKEDAGKIPGCVRDEITGEWKRLHKERYLPGDVLESDRDLVAMFGSKKFERVPDDYQLRQGGPTLRERLEAQTIPQLRDLADIEGVDLGSLTKKADIVDALVTTLEAVEA